MLNKAVIMGRLTRDPEIKTTQSDISVCSFSVACDRDIVDKATGKRGTDFINVTAWRSTADFVGKYFSKGRMIVVVGRIQVCNYTDKDGNKRTATEIVADSVYFGDSKKDGDSSGNSGAPASAGASSSAPQGGDSFAELGDSNEDDLPF